MGNSLSPDDVLESRDEGTSSHEKKILVLCVLERERAKSHAENAFVMMVVALVAAYVCYKSSQEIKALLTPKN